MKQKKLKSYSRQQVRRNRRIALVCIVVFTILLLALIVWGVSGLFSKTDEKDRSGGISSSEHLSSGESFSSEADHSSSAVESASSSVPVSSSSSSAASSSASSAPSSSSSSKDPYFESSMPLLVNPDNLMPDDYSPTVVSVGGNYKLETKAAAAWKEMQSAASKDGVSLWIISAYRTLERQTELYDQKVQEYKNLGYSEADAKAEAGKWVAVPGTSEHCLGYAADLCSLEESFESSSQFAWLQKHAAAYGFILRYPKDKVDITKISYEPWHYRYVGSNHAKIIWDEGLCLEEYLDKYAD